jgi:hypothetical protein
MPNNQSGMEQPAATNKKLWPQLNTDQQFCFIRVHRCSSVAKCVFQQPAAPRALQQKKLLAADERR